MRCLLEGQVSEYTEIPIPHGKITIQLNGANPNYSFFLKNFWKDLGRTVRLRFGNCHLGEAGQENVASLSIKEKTSSSLDPRWMEKMDDFKFYVTKSGRYAVTSTFIGKDGVKHTVRMNRNNQNALVRNFLKDLEALL